MRGTYKVDANGTLLRVTAEQLASLRLRFFDEALSAKVSDLLLLDMHVLQVAHTIEPEQVVAEIRSLEPGGGRSMTKAAAPFEKLPLRGLWHKHFVSTGTPAHTREGSPPKNPEHRVLTGDWIVYLPHIGGNRYLCLANHDTPDQLILDRIIRYCLVDFPDLPEWLARARAFR